MYFALAILCAIATAGLGNIFVCIVAAIDGYKIAEKLNRGQAVGAWEFF